MQDIKNSAGKLICRVDAEEKMVEIVHKGVRTVIYMHDDGSYNIENTTLVKVS